jgi:hypothetical protein
MARSRARRGGGEDCELGVCRAALQFRHSSTGTERIVTMVWFESRRATEAITPFSLTLGE